MKRGSPKVGAKFQAQGEKKEEKIREREREGHHDLQCSFFSPHRRSILLQFNSFGSVWLLEELPIWRLLNWHDLGG